MENFSEVYQLLDNPNGAQDWTWVGTGIGEYFLVENRQKIGFDAALPGDGLLIWHINESRGNNSIDNRRLVDLEEADGLNHLDTKTNYGDSGDPWYSNTAGFSESSNPNSSLYNGSASGIRVTGISASSSVMTANLIVNWPPPIISFVPLTPANGSTLLQNYVFVNITANEALNTSLLEWNGANESMSGSGTNWNKNKTGLTSGVYIYRVWANDSGGNWNVSETRTVTINANIVSTCTNLNTPGYYTLTGSIMNSGATNCINITSSNVTFDGAGYTIDGTNASNSYGIKVNNFTNLANITIKNLTVTDWYYGIYYDNTTNGNITNSTLISNVYGIYLASSNGSNLSNNNVSLNLNRGIYLLASSNNSMLVNNIVNDNAGYGIITFSSNNVLIQNRANNNRGGSGIILSSGSNNILENNTAINNSGNGFYITISGNATLMNNTANSNSENGFLLFYSSNSSFNGNMATLNSFYGFAFESSNNNTLTNNSANNNLWYGFILSSSDNNTVSGNSASDNLYGIFLLYSDNNTVANNTATTNNIYGMLIDVKPQYHYQ